MLLLKCVTELLSPPPECKNSPLMVTKIYVFTCEYVCKAVVDKNFCVWPLRTLLAKVTKQNLRQECRLFPLTSESAILSAELS